MNKISLKTLFILLILLINNFSKAQSDTQTSDKNENNYSITLRFIVNEYGDISQMECLNGTESKPCAVAMDLLDSMPLWKPAYKNNHPTLSINCLTIDMAKPPTLFRGLFTRKQKKK